MPDCLAYTTADQMLGYSYDALSRLTGSTATGQTRAYSYNGDGTLVQGATNGLTSTYTQDLAGGLSQILAGTTGIITTDYLYGTGRLAALAGTTRTWYGADGQGSVRQTLSDAGAVTLGWVQGRHSAAPRRLTEQRAAPTMGARA